MASLNNIKNWFKTGLKPTQAQFWAVFDSFWHKEEQIPLDKIENIQNVFYDKVDKLQGKELSTNDFTDDLKEKLENLEDTTGQTLQEVVDKTKLSDGELIANLGAAFIEDDGGWFRIKGNAESSEVEIGGKIASIKFKNDKAEFVNGQGAINKHGIQYREEQDLQPNSLVDKRYVDSKSFPAPFAEIDKFLFAFNYTEDIELTGYYFTPDTIVAIDGQTVNSVIFVNPNKLIVNITSNSAIGLYDVIISNYGKEFILSNAFEVDDLTMIVPDLTVDWVRKSANVTTSSGKLVPIGNSTGWNKGGSFGTVPAGQDFTLSFNLCYENSPLYGNITIGFDEVDPDFSNTTIDYCFYIYGNNGQLYCKAMENGSYKSSFGNNYSITDNYKITRTAGVVKFYINDELKYTSATPSNGKAVFDVSIYRILGAKNIKIYY